VYPLLHAYRPQQDSGEEPGLESIGVERLDHFGVMASVSKD
jgi:hypothetical protein